MVWINLYNNKFSVKYLYATLESGSLVSFPKWVLWNSWVPSKVDFFCVGPSWSKVFSLDQIQKKGWFLVRCFLCKEEEESIDHILLHYSLVRIFW